MAAKRKNSGGQASADTLRRIWTMMSPDTWKDFLDRYRQGHNWFYKGGNYNKEVWGRCVYHDDPNASFHVRFNQGYAKCFGACNTFEADPVSFAAKVMNTSYSDAFNFLVTTYGLTGFPPAVINQFREDNARQQTKKHILSMLNTELCDAATSGRTDPTFAYAQKLVDWLEERKISLNLLHTLPIGIVPPPDRLWQRLNELEQATKGERHHAAVQKYLQEYIPTKPLDKDQAAYSGWLLFANHTAPGSIGLFRIREPRSKEIRVIQENERTSSALGFFGIGTGLFQSVIGNTESEVSKQVVVVEGEFTAMAAIINQVATGNAQAVVVAAGGNNNHCLDPLGDLGFEEVRIVGDMDAGGNTFTSLHLQHTKKVKARVFNWPDSLKVGGNDLHDAYMHLGGQVVADAVADHSNYLFPQQWALQALDVERENYDAADVGGLAQLAVRYARYLNDDTERELYAQESAKLLGIPEGQIKKYSGNSNDEPGYISLLCQHFEKVYRFIYQEQSGGARRAYAWNRKDRRLTIFDLSKRSAALGSLMGDLGSLVDYIANNVGEPAWLRDQVDDNGNTVPQKTGLKQKQYEELLLDQVIPRLAAGLPMKQHLTILGQGLHYKNGKLYLVNGDLFLRGKVNETNGIVWEDVDGPCEDGVLVDKADAAARWSDVAVSAEVINQYPPVDLARLYVKARETFNTGWAFRNHGLEIQYLAGLIFTPLMADLYEGMPWVFVKAPPASGKSNLVLAALSGNLKTKGIQMLEASYGTDNVSEAGLRQTMNHTSLMLILDEFEPASEGERNPQTKQRVCRQILQDIRGAAAQGSSIVKGSVSGEGVRYHLRFPLICAGTRGLSDRIDVTRFNIVELMHIEGGVKGTTPDQVILAKTSREELTEIRHGTTMWALQNIVRMKQAYQEVRQEFANNQHCDPRVESRFKEALFPVTTIMKLAGADYKAFMAQYTKVKTEAVKDDFTMNDYDEVWSALLHQPGVRLPSEEKTGETYTLAELLNDPHKRDDINRTNTGVYYIPSRKYLVVSWPTAVQGILRTSQFAGRQASYFKGTMHQDRRVISQEAARRDTAVMQQLRACGARVHDVTVIPAAHFIADENAQDAKGLEESFVEASRPVDITTKSAQMAADVGDAPKTFGDSGNI